MFKFLKDKLKGAISKISKGIEEEGKQEEMEVEVEAKPESKLQEKAKQKDEAPKAQGFFSKLKDKIIGKEEHSVSREELPAQKEPKKLQESIIIEPKTSEKKEPELKSTYSEKVQIRQKDEIKTAKPGPKKPEIKYKEAPLVEVKTEVKAEQKIEIKPPIHPPEKIKHREEEEPKIEVKVHPKTEIKIVPIEKPKTEGQKPKPEIKPSITKHTEEEPKEDEKKGFFASLKEKIITTKIDEGQFESLFWEMELALMENNVAMEVIEKIKNDLKDKLVEKPIRRTKVEDTILETLKASIAGLFESSTLNVIDEIKNKEPKPYVIAFLGINGSGKTTSIAKIASMLKQKGFSVVLAAADTFRAASIEQLNLHAEKIGIKMIKHDYGADPAAVAFDAIKHAQAKNIDVVLIDTAGRMHSNENLVAEMKKIIRVAKPDLKIFVGESITGNDCVEQAKTFNEAVGIDGIILAKADIDEKGGAAISVSYVTKKPILFLGTGQEYKDIEPFNKERIIRNIGLA